MPWPFASALRPFIVRDERVNVQARRDALRRHQTAGLPPIRAADARLLRSHGDESDRLIHGGEH